MSNVFFGRKNCLYARLLAKILVYQVSLDLSTTLVSPRTALLEVLLYIFYHSNVIYVRPPEGMDQ